MGGTGGRSKHPYLQKSLPIAVPPRPAWNKGRIVGQKRPLALKRVWSIRVRLEMADNKRDLTLFNLAIDSKLRVCDLVRRKVRDVFAAGHAEERTSVIQSKTSKPVRFKITETTRQSLDKWIADPEITESEFLWPTRLHASPHLSTRQYARIMGERVTSPLALSQVPMARIP